MHSSLRHLDGYGGEDGTSMEKVGVHSLASDSFAPTTRQKTALGFTPFETRRLIAELQWCGIFDRYGGEFLIGIAGVAAGNPDSRPPGP
jgi:hypothetical protein